MATTNDTAYSVATETFGTTSPVTGAAPTLVTDGLASASLAYVTVYVSSATGTTLSGAGTLSAYEWSPTLGRWARTPSEDFTLTTSGVRDLEAGIVLVAGFKMTSANGGTRIKYVPTGVTFSAGTAGVVVTLVGTNRDSAGNGNL